MNRADFQPSPGDAYFILMYEDEALSVPVVQTLLFKESKSIDREKCHVFHELDARGEKGEFVVRDVHVEELLLDMGG